MGIGENLPTIRALVETHVCGDCGTEYAAHWTDAARVLVPAKATIAWIPGRGYPADRRCRTCRCQLPLAPPPRLADATWIADDPISTKIYEPRPASQLRMTRADAARLPSFKPGDVLIATIGAELLELVVTGRAEFVDGDPEAIDIWILDLHTHKRSKRPEVDGAPIAIIEMRTFAAKEAAAREARRRVVPPPGW